MPTATMTQKVESAGIRVKPSEGWTFLNHCLDYTAEIMRGGFVIGSMFSKTVWMQILSDSPSGFSDINKLKVKFWEFSGTGKSVELNSVFTRTAFYYSKGIKTAAKRLERVKNAVQELTNDVYNKTFLQRAMLRKAQ